ncbi:MAG TPA: LpqB family beta-propeller domain-containing protein [Gaiellaceae bacterium]|nr:LpqB family beta-propeller domain-containing protein [Gaiellaceae bacterium]
MRVAPLALLALVLAVAGSAPAAATFSSALAYSRPLESGGGVFVMERSGRVRLVARDGISPAWSPDGRRVAFVAADADGQRELYVADADGRHRAALTRTPGQDEISASWSPDGRRLVVERDGRLVTIGADGRDERFLAAGSSPVWSPRGGQIAFVSDGTGVNSLYIIASNGRGLRRVTTSGEPESEPAWSPDGTRLAYVSLTGEVTDLRVVSVENREVVALTQDASLESSPVWSPGGDSIWFVTDRPGGGPLWSIPIGGGIPTPLGGPAGIGRFGLRPAISPELRPDLDQKPPAELSVLSVRRGGRRHHLLGFKSATDNLGLGPLSVIASRASHLFPTMRAAQRIRLTGGGARTYPGVGVLRYTFSPSHTHWHLMDFQRYELRRARDHSLVLRDHKSGFCLTDRWSHRVAVLPGSPRRPRFTDYCARSNPRAVFVAQGTSVGFSDVYPSHFHGQNLEITRVPAGVYELVHRANPRLLIRELRYENDAASLRIRIAWPRGRGRAPAIRILATCAASEYCAP